MKILDVVTVTGADDKTDISKLVEIQTKYPYVEFGLLYSRKQEGSTRFPSKDWLSEVVRNKLNLSLHLCGGVVRRQYGSICLVKKGAVMNMYLEDVAVTGN